MEHHPALLSVVIVAFIALITGMVFARFRQPALVGYILTGLLLGPSGIGVIENRESIAFLAELGVLLLLYVVGMELSLRGFRAVWLIATVTTGLQIAAAVGIMFLISRFFGWSPATAVLLGFVVAVKMLQELNILQTQVGQLTVAILIAQDLAIVPMMLITGSMAGEASGFTGLYKVILAVLLLAAIVWFLGRRKKVSLPFAAALAGSLDLRPLYGLVLCFGAALATEFLGLTAAYGAFLAGLLVCNSSARRTIGRSIKPVQSLLIMVFFVSVGLLIDLSFVWRHFGEVALIIFVVTVVKTALNIGILTLLREPWPHAFISGVMLAQIGEFSFLLGAAGQARGLIDATEFQLIVAVTAFSLVVSPIWLTAARRLLRVALTGATSVRQMLSRIREGGVKAVWFAANTRVMPSALALRILGRPRLSGFIRDPDPQDSDSPQPPQ